MVSPDSELWVDTSAATDAATVVNIVHHFYWNLAGHDSGSILDHELTVYAKHAGICPESQLHPDWPSPRFDPGATYRHTMVHRFRTR